MTETMQEIRRRRNTVESAGHITGAMHLVSAAKFRRSKARYDRMAAGLQGTLHRMEGLLQQMEAVPGAGSVLLVYTASRGLCGGYNSSILKLAVQYCSQMEPTPLLLVVGSKGCDFLRRQGCPVFRSMEDAPESMTLQHAASLAGDVMQAWEQSGRGKILLCCMGYRNTLHQEPELRQLYPVRPAEREEQNSDGEMEYLPSRQEVAQWMLPKYLQLAIYAGAAESAVCEHGARRMAMESAAENARDMLDMLTMTYYRARQQAITEELIEIVSGAESLK